MEYKIFGEPLPAVTCTVEEGEVLITERGAMSWMTANMNMQTSTNGGVGKALGRMFSGESMFQNRYSSTGGKGQITFSSDMPGVIRAFDIAPGKEMICQKTAFLASEESVDLSIFFQRKLGAGLVGGEGFIMQKLSGTGTAFIEVDGNAVEYNLEEGQKIIVDTGYLAAMEATCSMEVVTIKGAKNVLFGGEGLFNTVVSGPGKVLLQTMPIMGLAGALAQYIPSGK